MFELQRMRSVQWKRSALSVLLLSTSLLAGGVGAGCSGQGEESPTPGTSTPAGPTSSPDGSPDVSPTTGTPDVSSPTTDPVSPTIMDVTQPPVPTPEVTPPTMLEACSPMYADLDKDGWGAGEPTCSPGAGYVSRNLDCNDADASVYPAAPDTPGDGKDSSCDGSDGMAPSLGLETSTFTTIQAALDAASNGQTVYVGPGLYREFELTFRGKAVSLIATSGEVNTLIDADWSGTVFKFQDQEGPDTVLEGFTLLHGVAQELCTDGGSGECNHWAGGIFVEAASPTLRNLTLSDNTSDGFSGAGGMVVYVGNPALESITFMRNLCTGEYCAGALSLYFSDVQLSGGWLQGNGSVSTNKCNAAGIDAYGSSPVLTNVTMVDNLCQSGSGGIHLYGGTLTQSGGWYAGNEGGFGGAGWAQEASFKLDHVVASGNRAIMGGGFLVESGQFSLQHGTVVANLATGREDALGGGVYVSGSSADIQNSILAYNTPGNLIVKAIGSEPVPLQLAYNNFYAPYGVSQNVGDALPLTTNLKPEFVSFSDDENPYNDDLHLGPGSELRDAADPAGCGDGSNTSCDPDGSRADLGAYAGPDADFSYYTDADDDGYYDGWELAHEHNITTLDGTGDVDGDGLDDATELYLGTASTKTDSDGDGASDKTEDLAGSNPLNAFSTPEYPDLKPMTVPSTLYPTLQAAVDAIPTGGAGAIELKAATYSETVVVARKYVRLTGKGQGATALEGNSAYSPLTVNGGTLDLSELTLRRGAGTLGGAAVFWGSAGTFESVSLRDNSCTAFGCGVAVWSSSPFFHNVNFVDNQGVGGVGAFVDSSVAIFDHVVFDNNRLLPNYTADGGAVYASQSLTRFSYVRLNANAATRFGAAYLSNGTASMDHVVLTGNVATTVTGGVGVSNTVLEVSDSIWAYNTAPQYPTFLLMSSGSRPTSLNLSYSNVYNPAVFGSDAYQPSETNLSVDPKFLSYRDALTGAVCIPGALLTCLPDDWHLALNSPLVHGGDPADSDADHSRSSPGIFGGLSGDEWDRDDDGFFDYFWAGEYADVPTGVQAADYDCDDNSAGNAGCP